MAEDIFENDLTLSVTQLSISAGQGLHSFCESGMLTWF